MNNDILEVLHDHETIQKRTREIASEIAADYEDKCPVVVCVLKGAAMFYTDLTRAMDIYMDLDFISASSYGNSTTSSGKVVIKHDLSISIEGRHVILVEDVVDSGLTLFELTKLLEQRKPASIKCATLCNKNARRTVEFKADYIGFEIDDKFLVGMGLDYAGKYRNLPYIGVLKPSVYSKEDK
jgi:hypoxanthine phosphoribosyltransferase